MAFIMPLMVMKVIKKPEIYNSIEYVISLSILLSIFIDLGLKNYLIYFARQLGHKERAILLSISAFKILFGLHVLAILGVLCSSYFFQDADLYLVSLAIARASALTIIGLSMQTMILSGYSAFSLVLSLVNWILCGLCFLAPSSFSTLGITTLFFTGSFLIVLSSIFFVFIADLKLEMRKSFSHLSESLQWGWPILLSAAAGMAVANVSKIYAFNDLSIEESVAFSFWMRIFSLIQLTHVAVISVLVIQIYDSSHKGILWGNFQRYINCILVIALFVVILPFCSQIFLPTFPIIGWVEIVSLASYFIFWVIGAYFETYLIKNAKNLLILKASIISFSIYGLGIFFAGPSSMLSLIWIMNASAACYTGLIALSLIEK